MYGHSKWFPNHFELDFGSIQRISLPKVCKSTFSQVVWSIQFLKNLFFIFLDRSQCRAYYDMKSSILQIIFERHF